MTTVLGFVGGDKYKWKNIANPEEKGKTYVKKVLAARAAHMIFKTSTLAPAIIDLAFTSGVCHRGGVDIWSQNAVEEINAKLPDIFQIKMRLHPAEVHDWNDKSRIQSQTIEEDMHGYVRTFGPKKLKGYRSRNMDIINDIKLGDFGSMLYDIEPTTMGGFIRSGGTWVYDRCKKFNRGMLVVVANEVTTEEKGIVA